MCVCVCVCGVCVSMNWTIIDSGKWRESFCAKPLLDLMTSYCQVNLRNTFRWNLNKNKMFLWGAIWIMMKNQFGEIWIKIPTCQISKYTGKFDCTTSAIWTAPMYYPFMWWVVLSIINTLRPRQICHHFADAIFKSILLNNAIWISLKTSVKFVPEVRIGNIPALVQIMPWRRPG